jgi:hypothetical protein
LRSFNQSVPPDLEVFNIWCHKKPVTVQFRLKISEIEGPPAGVIPRGRKACAYAKGGTETLAIFYHDPGHEDGFMEQVKTEARQLWSGANVAGENLRFNLL